MDDRARALYEAENDQLIGRIIELERVTSVLRLVQTLIVLLKWLIPLLEDVRISPQQSGYHRYVEGQSPVIGG